MILMVSKMANPIETDWKILLDKDDLGVPLFPTPSYFVASWTSDINEP